MREPQVIYDFDPRKLPRDLRAAIGLALAAASQTESVVATAIHACANVDFEYGGAITTHMAMPLKFSVLRSVAEIRIDDLDALDRLDDLLGQIDVAMAKRHRIAHGNWCTHPKTGDAFLLKESSRAGYKMDLVPMTVDEVERDAVFIYQVGMDLMSFLMEQGLAPRVPPIRQRAHKSAAERKKRRAAKR